jgi:hypothetical protein
LAADSQLMISAYLSRDSSLADSTVVQVQSPIVARGGAQVLCGVNPKMRHAHKGLSTSNGERQWTWPEAYTVVNSNIGDASDGRGGEWRPGGAAVADQSQVDRAVADLERKIGQLTLENDFLEKALQHSREHPPHQALVAPVTPKSV